MSNDYFTLAGAPTRHTNARAESVAGIFAAIEEAFDKFPALNNLIRGATNYAADTGAANAYIAAMPEAWTAYQDGATCRIKIATTNTGASTLDVDGLGIRPIKAPGGIDTAAGVLTAGQRHSFTYNADDDTFDMTSFDTAFFDNAAATEAAALANLEAVEERVELLEASVVAATGIDVSNYNNGDLLQVVSGALTMSGQRLENSAGFSGAAPSLDVATAQAFYGTLSANTTFTFSVSGANPTAANAMFFVVEVEQDAATPRAITWPASITWDFDDTPDPPETGKTAIYTFFSRNGGMSWRGGSIGRDFA